MIGLMVGLLLAGLIGVYLWRSHRTAPSDASPNPVVPSGDTGESFGGITFITKQGAASTAASNGGASAYNLADPTTAARRVDAVNRSIAADALAAQQGLTADQLYQQHLQHELDPNTPTNSKAPITNAQVWDARTGTWQPIAADPRTTQWSF